MDPDCTITANSALAPGVQTYCPYLKNFFFTIIYIVKTLAFGISNSNSYF